MEQRAVGQFKVFLVEDSPLLRTRLEAMLDSIAGATLVGHAETAKEAIERILVAQPDAVVLDLSLKDSNGFDVLRAVRKTAPQIAFYVLTNHPIDAFRAVAQRLGAKGFFDKSAEFEQFRDTLAAAARR
jgi:DNA-binding NarL/FixJ family response regulator